MTAGNGIVHSERAHHSHHPKEKLEGIQLWIALPQESEKIAPSFEHFKEKDLPLIKVDNIDWRLIAGEYGKTRSPVPTYSPLFYLVTKMQEGESSELLVPREQEGAIYIANGEVEIENQLQGEGHLVVFASGSPVKFKVTKNATLFVFGGTPFPEGRQIWWNFVASTQDLMEGAKVRWSEQTMGKVPHEVDWIPLPLA
jgi:redox-sensitive bicupin YhaK (pirin superfamily)